MLALLLLLKRNYFAVSYREVDTDSGCILGQMGPQVEEPVAGTIL